VHGAALPRMVTVVPAASMEAASIGDSRAPPWTSAALDPK
jgi:hypothetical protein